MYLVHRLLSSVIGQCCSCSKQSASVQTLDTANAFHCGFTFTACTPPRADLLPLLQRVSIQNHSPRASPPVIPVPRVCLTLSHHTWPPTPLPRVPPRGPLPNLDSVACSSCGCSGADQHRGDTGDGEGGGMAAHQGCSSDRRRHPRGAPQLLCMLRFWPYLYLSGITRIFASCRSSPIRSSG